ncbi:hypothetical protein SynA15127_01054 [Synechococcus sp. A15-127]|nr:hypothetical protein SynA15127_01054 [Synechococcus sp. A15-127]
MISGQRFRDGERRRSALMMVINSLLGDFGRVAMAAAVGAAAAAGVMLASQSSSSTRSELLRGALDRNQESPRSLLNQSMQNEFSRRQRNN